MFDVHPKIQVYNSAQQMRVYHVISKLRGQESDYHSWKELIEISKNVKFRKDRSTNCKDMNFQKSKFYMKTFGNLRLEATLAYQQRFSYKISIFEISYLHNL